MRVKQKQAVVFESGTYMANGGTVYFVKISSRKLKMTIKTFSRLSQGEDLKEKLLIEARKWAKENDYNIELIY